MADNFQKLFLIIIRFYGSVQSLENPFPESSWTARALCSSSSNWFVSNNLFYSSVELSHTFTMHLLTITRTTAFDRRKVRRPKNRFVRNTNARHRNSCRSCSTLSNKSWTSIKVRRIVPASLSRVCRKCVLNFFPRSRRSPSTPPTSRVVRSCRNLPPICEITPKCSEVCRVCCPAVFNSWAISPTILWSTTTPSINRWSFPLFTTCGRSERIHAW